jgi:hypothetical protein
LEALSKPIQITAGAWDPPDILRTARVHLNNTESPILQFSTELDAANSEDPHWAQSDRKKRNLSLSQFKVTDTIMFAVSILDGLSAGREV